jgi:uroporphyrinogen decarboxylase
MRERPTILAEALQVITQSLVNYVQKAAATGVHGIFYSVDGASDAVMTEDEYRVWGRPYDLAVLTAVDVRFKVLHLHGERLHFDSMADYPVGALSWSLHSGNPTWSEGRALSGKVVLGGIDERGLLQRNEAELSEEVASFVRGQGGRSVILTPGCLIPGDTPPRVLRGLREVVAALGSDGG